MLHDGLLDQVRTPYAKPHTGFVFRLGQTLVATLSAHDLRERNSSGVSSCSKMCSSLSAVLAMPGVQDVIVSQRQPALVYYFPVHDFMNGQAFLRTRSVAIGFIPSFADLC